MSMSKAFPPQSTLLLDPPWVSKHPCGPWLLHDTKFWLWCPAKDAVHSIGMRRFFAYGWKFTAYSGVFYLQLTISHLFSRASQKGFSFFSCGATPSRTVPKTQPLQVTFSLLERVDLRSPKEGILGKKIAWGRAGWTGQEKEKRMRKKRWDFSFFTCSWSFFAYRFSFFTYSWSFLLSVGKCV